VYVNKIANDRRNSQRKWLHRIPNTTSQSQRQQQDAMGLVCANPSCLPRHRGEKACSAYDMNEEQLQAELNRHNPIDRLEPLAKAHIPIYHIHGDSDTVAPIEKNSGTLAKLYRHAGGEITLNVIKGQGHNLWPGWFQCQELVDFVIANARK
jgi:pimeloyl-ACP methyl ester carboxylesterase